MTEPTVSTGKAARMCGVTPDTVLKWIKKGAIDAQRTPGGHFRIKTESLEPYITEYKAPEQSQQSQKDATGGDIDYCWEYHAKDGKIKTGCRNCMVFKAKAERCYLLAGIGAENGYEGTYCSDSCDNCPYFKYINKTIFNVLVITDNDQMKSSLSGGIDKRYSLCFSCCGYETATVIQDFRPDYIVIDDSMDKSKTEEITRYLINDPRVHGAQIILAVDNEKAKEQMQKGICAFIDLPFSSGDMEKCFQNLRIKLLGLHN